MTNVNSPFGFRYQGLYDGAVPNLGLTTGQALNSAAAMFYGDPLVITNGLLSAAPVVNNGSQIAGIAVAFEWMSKTNRSKLYTNYWPGAADSVNGANITVKFSANPDAVYEVQATNGPITQSSVGKFANFNAGTGGNTANGVSSYSLDDSTISAVQGNLPFKIVFIEQPPGTDPTSAFNRVRVAFANVNAGV